MNVRARVALLFAARDPGHARLTLAAAVAGGVLASALLANTFLTLLHADKALLAMSVFLSLQAGNAVKDRTAISRLATTAILIPCVFLAILSATLLSAYRPALIAVFVVLTGGAIWVCRFGRRAAAIGSLCFMGYFFALFMKPTMAQLPIFFLVAGCAIATQLIARAILLLKRPRRQITMLLKELRLASASAVRATTRPDHAESLRSALARIDEVGRAIAVWQQNFRTERHIACDESVLAAQVLDVRVDTEEACYASARVAASSGKSRSRALRHARIRLISVLDERAPASRITASTTWADRVLAARYRESDEDLAIYLLAKSTIAHARVREIDLTRGLTRAPHTMAASVSSPLPGKPATSHPPRLHWMLWREWAPTSRMALQAMVAASLASVVGEAISASRWYWAVMTAFVIFIGATTRSGILTRAFRRVSGTAIGIGVGIVVVALAGDDTRIVIGICVAAVFGMLYFGPLNYLYSSLFITIMLVAIYRMLGVLDQGILELRLVETLSGAIIGVLCAYLILSANSRPVVVAKLNGYFDALDQVLRSASAAFRTADKEGEVLASLQTLESAQADVDRALSSMATAFLVSGPRRESDAVHLMYIATRSAARLARSAAERTTSSAVPDQTDAGLAAVTAAISEVSASAAEARRSLCSSSDDAEPSAEQSSVLPELGQIPTGAASPETPAIMALVRLDWTLRQISEADARSALHHDRTSAATGRWRRASIKHR